MSSGKKTQIIIIIVLEKSQLICILCKITVYTVVPLPPLIMCDTLK